MKSRNADASRKVGQAFLSANPRVRADRNVRPTGLTLVEVMVTLLIFLVLAIFMFMAVREVVTQWTVGERRRVLYEKAAGVMNLIGDDIRLALTQEPMGATDVKARFIGDFEPNTNQQRIMFVRSFESGPERAITFNAGDGYVNDLMFTPPPDPDDPKPAPPAPTRGADGDVFDGMKVGDFKALGGMCMIGYFVKNQVLYRAIRAPVQGQMSALMTPASAQPIATDVLYFAVDYWSQFTRSWEEPKSKGAVYDGPEKVWDSTRGIAVFPLNKFILHRGAISLNDPEDDVFPQKVRITMTIDSSMPRCVHTILLDDIHESDMEIYVRNTRGFPDGGEDSFIRIDDEWMELKRRTDESFVIARRGVRGTKATAHSANAVVRAGRTFRRVVYIPNFREDFTRDDVYLARKAAQQPATRRLVR